MTVSELLAALRRWWRVPLVALLGGLVAFGGSFAIGPSYEASTKVLVRARATTLLSGDGQSLASQPGVVDGTLAVTIGETQSALLSSTRVAEEVVDELRLDERTEDGSGVVGALKDAAAGSVHRVRAWLTHGFYREPSPRERAIEEVHQGLRAVPLQDSYVLEVTGTGDTGQLAADITNTAADALVRLSRERYEAEATASRDFLAQQVQRAQADLADGVAAKRGFEQAKGFQDLPLDLQLDAASREQTEARLRTTEVDLRAARAQLAQLESSLAATPTTTSGSSSISTGRSSTTVLTSAPNNVREQLALERDRVAATVASLSAAQAALAAAVGGGAPELSPEDRAAYEGLADRVTAAQTTFQELSGQHAAAVLAVGRSTEEVTRIDRASAPTYPVGPQRYVYLALGLLCGATAGWLLSLLSERRRRVTATVGAGEPVTAEPSQDPSPPADTTALPLPPGAVDVDAAPAAVGLPGQRDGDAAARTVVGRYEVYRQDGRPPT